jgi:hypothetical protein
MTDLKDLSLKKDTLAAIDAEITAQTETFEAGIAELRAEREKLRAEYASALQAELESLNGAAAYSPSQRARRGTATKPDLAAIHAAIEKAQTPISVDRIRELAGVPSTVSSNSMSTALKLLIDDGRVIRSGVRRGTKYTIR